jgi:hypothetical protein
MPGKAKATRIPIPSALLILAMAVSPAMSSASPIYSNADIIFSSFGPGYSYRCCAGNGIGYNGESAQIAAAFTPLQQFSFLDIQLAIHQWAPAGSEFTFDVSLTADEGGHPSSTPLETWTNKFTPFPPSAPSTYELDATFLTVPGTISVITLFAGQQYWVVVSPVDTNTSVLWNNSIDLGADQVEFTDRALGGVWGAPQTSNGVAFDVEGIYDNQPPTTPSPEPVSGMFIPAGLAALFLLRKLLVQQFLGPHIVNPSCLANALHPVLVGQVKQSPARRHSDEEPESGKHFDFIKRLNIIEAGRRNIRMSEPFLDLLEIGVILRRCLKSLMLVQGD